MKRTLRIAILITFSVILFGCGGGGDTGSSNAFAGIWTETTTNGVDGPGTSITIATNGDVLCKWMGAASNCVLTSQDLGTGTYTFQGFEVVLNSADGTFVGTFPKAGETAGHWTGVFSGFKSDRLATYQGTWSETASNGVDGIGTAVKFASGGYITCSWKGTAYPCNLYLVDLGSSLFKFQDLGSGNRYSMTLNVSTGKFTGTFPKTGDVGENWTGTFSGARL